MAVVAAYPYRNGKRAAARAAPAQRIPYTSQGPSNSFQFRKPCEWPVPKKAIGGLKVGDGERELLGGFPVKPSTTTP